MNDRSSKRTNVQGRTPLRQRLATVRRDHIVDAATHVLAARGCAAATTREIARLAGVADGTIYLSFQNEAVLLLGILDRLNGSGQRQEHLAAARDADVAELVPAYLLAERWQDVPDTLAHLLVHGLAPSDPIGAPSHVPDPDQHA